MTDPALLALGPADRVAAHEANRADELEAVGPPLTTADLGRLLRWANIVVEDDPGAARYLLRLHFVRLHRARRAAVPGATGAIGRRLYAAREALGAVAEAAESLTVALKGLNAEAVTDLTEAGVNDLLELEWAIERLAKTAALSAELPIAKSARGSSSWAHLDALAVADVARAWLEAAGQELDDARCRLPSRHPLTKTLMLVLPAASIHSAKKTLRACLL